MRDIIPIRNMAYLVVCVVVITVFIFLVVCPSHRSLTRLDKESVRIKQSIDKQKTLLPLYYQLIEKSRMTVSYKLPLPEMEKLPEDKISLIPSIFKEIASKSGADTISANPDLRTLSSRAGSLLINTTVRGDLPCFRNFLIEIGKLPYLKGIEKLQIEQQATDKELKMKIWLEME
jgi:hypothetical protein